MTNQRFVHLLALYLTLPLGPAAFAATIISYESAITFGSIYQIDATTGATTVIGNGSGIALSSGPLPNTIIATTAVNIYERNIASGQAINYACLSQSGCNASPIDFARDSSTGSIYAIGSHPGLTGLQLFALNRTGVYYSFPDIMLVNYLPVGAIDNQTIRTIEYVPGFGLLGSDGSSLFTVNVTNGQASFLVPLTIGGLSGMAYDSDSGRLLGVSSQNPAGIYNITISSSVAQAALLNTAATSLSGLATATTIPERSSVALVAGACAAIAIFRRQRT